VVAILAIIVRTHLLHAVTPLASFGPERDNESINDILLSILDFGVKILNDEIDECGEKARKWICSSPDAIGVYRSMIRGVNGINLLENPLPVDNGFATINPHLRYPYSTPESPTFSAAILATPRLRLQILFGWIRSILCSFACLS